MSSPGGRAAGHTVEVAGRRVEISNPDKIFFPGIGATKLDLVGYYLAVAEPILRATGGRPAMLQRFPDGALGKSFFQKRVPPGAPEWLQTVEVSTPNGTTSRALVIADLAHVVWAVNLGCLGFHLWPFRVEDPDHADELRIDLDPQPGVVFEQVREAAGVCAGAARRAGHRGLPEDERQPRAARLRPARAALGLVRGARRRPWPSPASWSVAGPISSPPTGGRRSGAGGSSSTSTRTRRTRRSSGRGRRGSRTGGQVSTPLAWDEVAGVDPDELTIATVPERVQRLGDPWAEMADRPQSLEPLLEMAGRDRAAGLQDAPWPPEYPKQPDEPSRVAPSRAKKD